MSIRLLRMREKNNTYLSYNMVVGNAADSQMAMAFEVLDYALLSAPGAPLKQALLDVKAGKDVYGSYDDGILQPYFTVIAKGSNPDRKRRIRICDQTGTGRYC